MLEPTAESHTGTTGAEATCWEGVFISEGFFLCPLVLPAATDVTGMAAPEP